MNQLPRIKSSRFKIKLPVSRKTLTYEVMKVSDEKILLEAKESSDEKQYIEAIHSVLQNCTGEDLSKLNYADTIFLFLNIRNKSFPNEVLVMIPCEECGTENKIQLDFSNLKIDFKKPKTNVIDVGLDSNGIEIKMELKFPSLESFSNSDETLILRSCISKIIHGNQIIDLKNSEIDDDEFEEFYLNLPSPVLQKIKEFFDSSPSIHLDVEFKCSSCERDNKKKIENFSDFF